MKKLVLTLLVSISSLAIMAQVLPFSWERTYAFDTYGACFEADANGGYIGALTTENGTSIYKMDEHGELSEIQAWLPPQPGNWLKYCTHTEDGFAAVLFDSTITSVIMGGAVWTKKIKDFMPTHVVMDGNGNYIVSGFKKYGPYAYAAYYTMDETLTLVEDPAIFMDIAPHQKTYYLQIGVQMFPLSDGSLYLKYYTIGDNDTASLIARVQEDSIMWTRYFGGGPLERFLFHAAVDGNDNIAVVGNEFKEISLISPDNELVNTFRTDTYFKGKSQLRKIEATPDGFIAGGFINKGTHSDAHVVFFNSDLTVESDTSFGSATKEEMSWVISVADDRYLITGAQGADLKGGNFYAVELRKKTTGIQRTTSPDVALIAFPNPVEDRVTFSIPNWNGTVRITTLTGQEVGRVPVVNGQGTFLRDDLPAGIYISTAEGSQQKLIFK